MPTWRRLGRLIRRLRDARGMTRATLAAKSGLSEVYLDKLEAGDRISPSLQALDAIAKALGATLDVTITPRRHQRRKKRRG